MGPGRGHVGRGMWVIGRISMQLRGHSTIFTSMGYPVWGVGCLACAPQASFRFSRPAGGVSVQVGVQELGCGGASSGTWDVGRWAWDVGCGMCWASRRRAGGGPGSQGQPQSGKLAITSCKRIILCSNICRRVELRRLRLGRTRVGREVPGVRCGTKQQEDQRSPWV